MSAVQSTCDGSVHVSEAVAAGHYQMIRKGVRWKIIHAVIDITAKLPPRLAVPLEADQVQIMPGFVPFGMLPRAFVVGSQRIEAPVLSEDATSDPERRSIGTVRIVRQDGCLGPSMAICARGVLNPLLAAVFVHAAG